MAMITPKTTREMSISIGATILISKNVELSSGFTTTLITLMVFRTTLALKSNEMRIMITEKMMVPLLSFNVLNSESIKTQQTSV